MSTYDQLPVFDVQLVDAAIASGKQLLQVERQREAALVQARDDVQALLTRCARAANGLRGLVTTTVNAHVVYFIQPGRRGPQIIVSTGAIVDCATYEDLIVVWNALPEILSTHLKYCETHILELTKEIEHTKAISDGAQAIQILTETTPPDISLRQALIERIINDSAMRHACSTARATGDRETFAKLVRDQAGCSASSSSDECPSQYGYHREYHREY